MAKAVYELLARLAAWAKLSQSLDYGLAERGVELIKSGGQWVLSVDYATAWRWLYGGGAPPESLPADFEELLKRVVAIVLPLKIVYGINRLAAYSPSEAEKMARALAAAVQPAIQRNTATWSIDRELAHVAPDGYARLVPLEWWHESPPAPGAIEDAQLGRAWRLELAGSRAQEPLALYTELLDLFLAKLSTELNEAKSAPGKE